MTEDELFQAPPSPAHGWPHEFRAVEVAHAPELSYVVPVEPEWVCAMPTADAATDPHGPVAMGAFSEDASLRGARLVVTTQMLAWEVDPLEWLRYLWALSGWRIVVARTHPSLGGPRYELGGLRVRDGGHEVRRTIALRVGARLVRLDACVSLDRWPRLHDSLWHSLEGFRLGQPPARKSIEALTPCSGPLLRFAVPQSWAARGMGSAEDGVRWGASPIRDTQRGARIQVFAGHTDHSASPEARRADYRRRAREHHAVGALTPLERPLFAEHVRGWGGQWQAGVQTSRGDGVLVIVQRQHDGVSVDYVMQAPAAGTEHLDWMRATRALDVAITTTETRASAT